MVVIKKIVEDNFQVEVGEEKVSIKHEIKNFLPNRDLENFKVVDYLPCSIFGLEAEVYSVHNFQVSRNITFNNFCYSKLTIEAGRIEKNSSKTISYVVLPKFTGNSTLYYGNNLYELDGLHEVVAKPYGIEVQGIDFEKQEIFRKNSAKTKNFNLIIFLIAIFLLFIVFFSRKFLKFRTNKDMKAQ